MLCKDCGREYNLYTDSNYHYFDLCEDCVSDRNCISCQGTGYQDNTTCSDCHGTGQIYS